MSMINIDQLNREHVLWEWPASTKKPNYFDQCKRCLQSWPCQTRQLLTVIKELRSDLEEAEERIAFLQDDTIDQKEPL